MMIPSFTKPNFTKPTIRMPGARPLRKRYLMRSDVRETDNMYILDIDLPGFTKEDIKAHVENGYLYVEAGKAEQIESVKDDSSCENASEAKEPTAARKYIHKERYEGMYQRTFFIGSDIRQEDIKASYKHGVLRLDIPKVTEKMKKKSETIQIG